MARSCKANRIIFLCHVYLPVQQEAVLRTALSELDMDGVSKRLPQKWRRNFRDGAKTVRDTMNELDTMTCMLTKVSVVLRQVSN